MVKYKRGQLLKFEEIDLSSNNQPEPLMIKNISLINSLHPDYLLIVDNSYNNDIYVLKIFDIPLIEFKFNKDILSLNAVHIIKIHNNHKKLFPVSLMLSDDGLAIWLKRRSVPRKRRNMKNTLRN